MLTQFPPMGVYETLFKFADATAKYMGDPGTHPWAQGYPLTNSTNVCSDSTPGFYRGRCVTWNAAEVRTPHCMTLFDFHSVRWARSLSKMTCPSWRNACNNINRFSANLGQAYCCPISLKYAQSMPVER
jgi:hypothetical protein